MVDTADTATKPTDQLRPSPSSGEVAIPCPGEPLLEPMEELLEMEVAPAPHFANHLIHQMDVSEEEPSPSVAEVAKVTRTSWLQAAGGTSASRVADPVQEVELGLELEEDVEGEVDGKEQLKLEVQADEVKEELDSTQHEDGFQREGSRSLALPGKVYICTC